MACLSPAGAAGAATPLPRHLPPPGALGLSLSLASGRRGRPAMCRAGRSSAPPPAELPGAAGAGARADAQANAAEIVEENVNADDKAEADGLEAAGGVRGAGKPRRRAESTDWIASAVTRRFGIGAGLAWVGFLAFGVVSEQLKTRREVSLEQELTRDVESPTETLLPNGVSIADLRVGGGSMPSPGDLVLVSLVGRVAGSDNPFVDTTAPGSKDIVFTFGVRGLRGAVTEGLLSALASMRAGGKRVVQVPPQLGFGSEALQVTGANGDQLLIPGNSKLTYTVELKRVSIAPS